MAPNIQVYMPAKGKRPAEPAPFVLSEEDMVRLLRLDSIAKPYEALKRYRDLGMLKGTQVGRHVRFLLPDAVEFLQRSQKENPR